jgi:L-serine dehydratase
MKKALSMAGLVAEAEEKGCPIWKIILEREARDRLEDTQAIWDKMNARWKIMKESLEAGERSGNMSLSGLVGEEGMLMMQYLAEHKPLSGAGTLMAAGRAMGVSVINASLGKIVAAPTAGSCGILPAVLQTAGESEGVDENTVIASLFTAAGVGMIIEDNATTSGAKGGCQAECGAASCMAAVAAVEIAGGTPSQAANAGAIALKNFLGLVCDPVAGLVEVPCVKRNAIGAAVALLSADMALAGIKSKIPLDEVIEAMREIGDALPSSLKETSQGGLANTTTAKIIEKNLTVKNSPSTTNN